VRAEVREKATRWVLVRCWELDRVKMRARMKVRMRVKPWALECAWA
jgi:hypothetical protein